MKFPYGLADFRKIVEQGYYYADRTRHIALLEEAGDQLLFLRPRRFGKSLFLTTLENYYDLRLKDRFESLFGGLWIGPNPTPRHNQFIEGRYFQVYDNRDYRFSNELVIKTAFLITLFSDTFYIMDPETAIARRYTDLSMILRPDMRRYQLLDHLFEFKYVGLPALGLSGAEVKAMTWEALMALGPVREALEQAEAQLAGYRATLEAAYGGRLRLHTHAVAALGFDRLVWRSRDR